jgi:hypothetical protein
VLVFTVHVSRSDDSQSVNVAKVWGLRLRQLLADRIESKVNSKAMTRKTIEGLFRMIFLIVSFIAIIDGINA